MTLSPKNERLEIREAGEQDVDAVLDYLRGLLEERPPYLILPPTLPSRAQEWAWMEKYIRPSDSTLILAFSGSQVIGLLEFDGQTSPAPQGPGNMGMSVAALERHKGVGRALFSRFLEWAEDKSLTNRIDVHVYADNLPALALYQGMGLVELSRLKATKCCTDKHINEIIRMALPSAHGSTPTIRQAVLGDIPVLMGLNVEVQRFHVEQFPWAFKETDPHALANRFRELMTTASVKVFVAEQDPESTVTGYLVLRAVERGENICQPPRRFGYVDQICVAGGFRGRGIGRALIDRAIVETCQLGMPRLELDAWEDNISAIKAFEALGFKTSCRKMAIDIGAQ